MFASITFQGNKFGLTAEGKPDIHVRVLLTNDLGVCKTTLYENIRKEPSIVIANIAGFIFQSACESLRQPFQKLCCLLPKSLDRDLGVMRFRSIHPNQANRLAIIQ